MKCTANHHPLNSWLMYLETKTLGVQPVFLRLHSVLAYLIYAFFSFRIVQYWQKNTIFALFIWLILQFNPFLLDFFSLARGYGMATAFATAMRPTRRRYDAGTNGCIMLIVPIMHWRMLARIWSKKARRRSARKP